MLSQIFAIRTLLTMVPFFQYENDEYEQIQTNIQINKLLSLECKLKIVECIDDNAISIIFKR